jgi:hypothetical protein
VRRRADDPWAVSSKLTYVVAKPHYIDVDLRCVPHDPALFGRRGYAVLLFANYMNDVEDVAPHLRKSPSKWRSNRVTVAGLS